MDREKYKIDRKFPVIYANLDIFMFFLPYTNYKWNRKCYLTFF